jgi:hypothetical protein
VSSSFEKDEYFRVEEAPTGVRLTHTRQSRVGQADEAFGDRIMRHGEHKFVFTIDCAHSSTGTGVYLGAASASADGHARRRFGVRVSDGRFVMYPAGPASGSASAVNCSEGWMGAAQSERAVGRRVEVLCDMDRRRLSFSVDGAAHVDCGVLPDELPDALVPWVQVFFKSDVVTLSQHRSRRGSGPPSPPAPVRVAPPAKVYEATPFEAGPWTP